MTRVKSVFSFKTLAALTVAVLLVHIAVLRAAPMSVDQGMGTGQSAPRAFTTRSVELVTANPPSAERPRAPVVTTQLKSQSRRPSAVTAEMPIPGDQLASRADEAPQFSTTLSAADKPSPEPPGPSQNAQPEDGQAAAADQLALAPLPPRPLRNPAPPVSADSIPRSVRLKYTVQANKFPYNLNAELLWQQTGESYDARLEFNAFGQARVQTSRGQITPRGLAPVRFSDKYRSEVAAHFNREQGKVTFSANTPDVPLLTGAQDRLSVLVQLASMIAGAPGDYPQATTIAIQTIGPRDADTWLFTMGSEETLTLPGGEQATLKLVRNPRQEFDQKVELWLAPALGYLPARVRITEPNGDFIDQKWLATEPPN